MQLPYEYQKIYTEHYINNREGRTSASFLSQKMEAWLHKKVAQDLHGKHDKATLEIGAGTLNQLNFEDTRPYDIVEPFEDLYIASSKLSKVDRIYSDIADVEISKRYDRITSIAVFEHVENLPEMIARTCILLKEGGCLRVSIPNEGTVLWKLGWKLSGLEFRRKYGLDYAVLMRYEHVNTADEIEEVLAYFYRSLRSSFFGPNRKFAFYRFYECRMPDVALAKRFLEFK